MKLLYITNGINGAGGLERVLSIKASYLADILHYDVSVLVLNNGADAPFYSFSSKIQYYHISVSGNPLQYFQKYRLGINAVVNQINPNVISVCDDGLKAFFLPLLLKKKRPIIYERHVSKQIELYESQSYVKSLIVKGKFKIMHLLAKKFDKFIVLTKDNLNEWDLPNIEVISNPLTFYPKASSSLTTKKVIAVGKHGYQKGYDLLMQSWLIVQKEHPDWELLIYGKLDADKIVVKLADSLGISNSVHFHAPEKNILDKFLDSSIFVFPSRFEGFGMVLIEAMACGLPSVSYDCPCGPKDIIDDGGDGFLVANGAIEVFAQKINDLIENETLRNRLGKTAKENVKRYLPEHIMPQWDVLFKSLQQ